METIFEKIKQNIVNDTVDRMRDMLEEEGTCDATEYHVDECVGWFIEDLQQYLYEHRDSMILDVDEKMRGE